MNKLESIEAVLTKYFTLTLIVSLLLTARVFSLANPLPFVSTLPPDSQLNKALEQVFHSDGISYKTCLENIQILIRSALKKGANLQDAEVLIFNSPNDFLRPKSKRWQQVPYYDFHVVLIKNGWVYDFAAQSSLGTPRIFQIRDYFKNLFPKNRPVNLRFKAIPAYKLLLDAHQSLPISDKHTYDFIRKVWQEEGPYYKKLVFNNEIPMTLDELLKRRLPLSCSKIFRGD